MLQRRFRGESLNILQTQTYIRVAKKKRTTKLVYSAVVKIMKNSFDYECVVKTKCTDFSHFILIVYFGLAFRIERGSCVFASDGETIVEKSTKRVIIFPSLTPFRHLLFLEWLSWRCLYLFVHTRTYVLAYLAFFSLHLHLCLQAQLSFPSILSLYRCRFIYLLDFSL